MSMIGYFFLVSDVELRNAESSPEAFEQLIDAAYEDQQEDLVNVDKAWHCLHFLLTGTAEEGAPPLDFIMRGGREVGDDMGYGPARAFDSREVKAIADALDQIEHPDLVSRFNGATMDRLEIYPHGGWSKVDPKSEEAFGYFSSAFDIVRDLSRRGRDAGLSMLVWLS